MILLFTDIHFDLYRRFSTTRSDGMNTRLYEQVLVMTRLIEEVKKLQPSAVVFLGDMFYGLGATISKKLYTVCFKLFEKLQRESHVYIIVGNHDMYLGDHIIEPFSSLEEVSLVSHTASVYLEGNKATLVPWGGIVPQGPSGLLMGHLDIEGAKTGAGIHLEGTIHPKEVAHYDKVFSGHWHTPQIMGNIEYIGSVMQNNFGDMFNYRCGITIMKDNLEQEFIHIDSPTFNVVDIEGGIDLDNFVAHKNSYNYYKLIVHDRKLELPNFDYHVEVEWDVTQKMETRLEQKDDEDLGTTVENFIDQAKADVDKERAKEILREVMR